MSSTSTRSHARSLPLIEGQSRMAGSVAGASGDQAPEPRRFRPQVTRSLKARPRLAGFIALVAAGLVVTLALRMPHTYSAESLVYIEPMLMATLTDPGSGGFDQTRYSSYIEQQLQTVTRPDVLKSALDSLPDRKEWIFTGESEQSSVGRLQKALTVERVLSSYQISIRLSSDNAKTSADVVNAVTQAYLQSSRRDELAQADGRVRSLSEERERLKEELVSARQEQAGVGASLGVANPTGESGDPYDSQLVSLRTQLAAAREAHAFAAAQLDAVGGSGDQRQSGLTAAADEALNTEAGLSSMKNSVNARRAILAGQMAGLLPSNPQFKQDQDEIADLDRSLDLMTTKLRGNAERRIEDKLRSDVTRTIDVENRLNAELSELTARATGAAPRLQRANELATDIQRLTQRYGIVDEALRVLSLQTNGPAEARLVLAAAVPSAPEPSKRNLILLAALPLGLLCGVIVAVLARLRNGRIFRASDLEQITGFPPIAVLPARTDVSALTYDEYILRLAAGLESAYRISAARVFVVTAASSVTHTLPLLQAIGGKLEDLRLRVDLIAAGDLLMNAKEMVAFHAKPPLQGFQSDPVATESAASKLERLKTSSDIILVNAAPLLLSAGTEYAVRCADATLLVVESGNTLDEEVEASLKLLARLNPRGIALVLQDLSLVDAEASFQAVVRAMEQRNQSAAGVPAVLHPGNAVEPMLHDHELSQVQKPATATIVHDSRSEVAELFNVAVQSEVAPPVEVPQVSPETIRKEAGIPAVKAAIPTAKSIIEQLTQESSAAEISAEIVTVLSLSAENNILADEPVQIPQSFDAGIEIAAGSLHWLPKHGVVRADETKETTKADKILSEPGRGSVIPEQADDVVIAGGCKTATLIEVCQSHTIAESNTNTVNEDEQQPVGRYLRGETAQSELEVDTHSSTTGILKEQDVSAKRAWFSKLFRGDSPDKLRVIAQEESEAHENVNSGQRQNEAQGKNLSVQSLHIAEKKSEQSFGKVSEDAACWESAEATEGALVPSVSAANMTTQRERALIIPEPASTLSVPAVEEDEVSRAEEVPEVLLPTPDVIREAAVFEWPVQHRMRDQEEPYEPRTRSPQRELVSTGSDSGSGTYAAHGHEGADAMAGRPRMASDRSSFRGSAGSNYVARGPQLEESGKPSAQPPDIAGPHLSRFSAISAARAANLPQPQLHDEAEERFANAFSSEPLCTRSERSRMELPVRNIPDPADERERKAVSLPLQTQTSNSFETMPSPSEASRSSLAVDSGMTRRWGLLSKFQEGFTELGRHASELRNEPTPADRS